MSSVPNDNLTTEGGMLRYLLRVNEHGIWFHYREGMYMQVPRWMEAYCKLAVSNPIIIGVTEEPKWKGSNAKGD